MVSHIHVLAVKEQLDSVPKEEEMSFVSIQMRDGVKEYHHVPVVLTDHGIWLMDYMGQATFFPWHSVAYMTH